MIHIQEHVGLRQRNKRNFASILAQKAKSFEFSLPLYAFL